MAGQLPATGAAIRSALDRNALSIDHRSTAVPGFEAKDIIDIEVSAASLDDEASFRPQLESLGHVCRPDDEQEHRFFKLDDKLGRRVAHVHVCRAGGPWERGIRRSATIYGAILTSPKATPR